MSRWGAGRRSAGHDAGVTVAETVVAMSIMGVVLTAFTSGMIHIYRSVQQTETTSIAQSQMHAAFARLDRELRYSSGVGTPVQQPGNVHIVEYESTITDTSRCFRLRLDLGRGVLQQRHWQPGNQASMTAWSTVATGVGLITRPGAVAPPPFALTGSDTTVRYQRLRVRLATTSAGTAREVDATFTALNTSLTTDSRTTCSEGR